MSLKKSKRSPKHLKPIEVKEVKEPINFSIYFIIIFIVLVIATGLIVWDRLTVREIKIEGLEKVNYLEIVHLSGIKYMSNIFTVDLEDVTKNIEQYPVLKVMDIKRQIPDTIVITIEEREPIAWLNAQDKNLVISKNCIALEISENAINTENIKIIGTEVISYELSECISLSKDIHIKKLNLLLNAISDANIQDHIKSIDITFTENIKLQSKEGYEIQIGNSDNIENKCLWIKTMIPKLIEEERQGGVLYITNVDSAHYIAPEDGE